MARKLIDTKSVISYDDQKRHAMDSDRYRAMLSRGKERAERYSIMSNRSSSRRKFRKDGSLVSKSLELGAGFKRISRPVERHDASVS